MLFLGRGGEVSTIGGDFPLTLGCMRRKRIPDYFVLMMYKYGVGTCLQLPLPT